MRYSRIGLPFLNCLLLTALTSPVAQAFQSGLQQDYFALKALYDVTDGGNWTYNTGWDTTLTGSQITAQVIDGFEGVTVGQGRVVGVNLSSNSLAGSIPPELGNLASLEVLALYSNALTGPIPSELGNLANLEWLSLYINALTGPIPSELGNLANLERLLLDQNALTGPIPVELGNLARLKWLNLADNALTGPIPSELGNLVILESLYLTDNALTGPIPSELGSISKLEWLELDNNALTGPIPVELSNLTKLMFLRLHNNRLTGPIPPELGNLSFLKELSVYDNVLTGSIPSTLGNLSDLESLFLHRNGFTGPIPSELGNLSKLDSLELSGNALTGPIPSELGDLVRLRWLGLNDNNLSGNMPSEVGNLTNLNVLYLDGNALTGPIPSELGNLENMQWLHLSRNNLSGYVPDELGNLTNLIELYLYDNALTGTLPLTLTQILPFPSGPLYYLHFGGVGDSLCAPLNPVFQAWLDRIDTVIGPNCTGARFVEGISDQAYVAGKSVAIEFPEAAFSFPPVTYTLLPDPPEGLTYDASNRTLSGTATTVTAPATYTYKAVDAAPSADSLQFTIEVVSQMTLPDSIPAQTYIANEAITPLVFPEAQGGAPPYTYTLIPDPPSGLTFDANTRTLSGTPNETMPQATYTYTVMDSVAQKDSLQFTIVVLPVLGTVRGELPTAFTLQGNFPNPFQQSTRIVFDLPWPASVSVEVLDVLGRRVLLMPARDMPAGWERGIDLSATAIPSGTYLYRLRLDGPTGGMVRPGSFVRIK